MGAGWRWLVWSILGDPEKRQSTHKCAQPDVKFKQQNAQMQQLWHLQMSGFTEISSLLFDATDFENLVLGTAKPGDTLVPSEALEALVPNAVCKFSCESLSQLDASTQ